VSAEQAPGAGDDRSPGAGREPLDAAGLTRAIVVPGGLWRSVTVTGQTGSTNADLLAQAANGAPEGTVLVANAQSAGRGRMGRSWVSPPGAALMFSFLLRPVSVSPGKRGWIPLLAGVAVASAVRSVTGLEARLKWPNDVLIGEAKLAGILTEQSADAIVTGIGINVSTQRAELPAQTATSLAVAGAVAPDRHDLLRAILAEVERHYLAWSGPPAPGDPDTCGLRPEYRRLSATLTRQVRVEFPGGSTVHGTATDIDPDGRLLVRTASGPLAVSAGDVLHLR
jgi:BirA family transcriptional regulator, biotin operon repressor / biotin---[acetyl-CoA-carboxylase] ligase